MVWIDHLLALNYVRLAIPLFLVLIAVEALWSWWQGLRLYRLDDTINSISCGILSQIMAVFAKAPLVGVYQLCEERYGLFNFTTLGAGSKVAVVILLILSIDLCYYWFHRLAHVVNIGWATHVVHHQSEQYNLATALRQGAFQDFFSFSFYLPLALLGFPTPWFLALSSLNTTYQFWIHTRTIKKLPRIIEFWFNTPSHHRVHHGRNACYIDKNHAGIFIIWDRLFGSFAPEVEEPRYGITTPLASWNPLWAQTHYFVSLWQDSLKAQRWGDRLQLWWRRPGWQPLASLAKAAEEDESKWEQSTQEALQHPAASCAGEPCRSCLGVSCGLFVAGIVLGVGVLFADMSGLLRLLGGVATLALLVGCGLFLEGKGFRGPHQSFLRLKP